VIEESIARGGELFMLDMGRPVRIKELAERMIQLYAAQGGQKKIDIVCTGLRPGEKLYEELLTDGENIVRTDLPKIFVTKPEVVTMEAMEAMLSSLRDCVDQDGDMLALLHRLVPTYQSPEEVNHRADAARKTAQASADYAAGGCGTP
jgi:FlaA1/EpsC-like NDP-sugar epimerase